MNHELRVQKVGQVVIASCSCGKWQDRVVHHWAESSTRAEEAIKLAHLSHVEGKMGAAARGASPAPATRLSGRY